MKKLLILMIFIGTVVRLEASSQTADDADKSKSQHVTQSKSWANDVRDSKSKEADFMTEEELRVLYHLHQQRHCDEGRADNDDNSANKDSRLTRQSEVSKEIDEAQVDMSLIAQWQRYFMQIYAYIYGK